MHKVLRFRWDRLFLRLKQVFGPGDTSLRESLVGALGDDDAGHDESFRGEELHMLRNLLGFKDVRVHDVMVLRADISAVEAGISLAELSQRFIESGHSRLPVYRETLDDLIGAVHVRDVFALSVGETQIADDFMNQLYRDVLFVPPSMPALDLLLRMQAGRTHMAIVVDEYGGTDGLVTIGDLVEEIVGEIEDEDEEEEEEPKLHIHPNGLIEAHARVPVSELESYLGVALVAPEDDIDTLGGLVFAAAGHMPQRGEVISHKTGLEFEICDADPKRIKLLYIRGISALKKQSAPSIADGQ